MPYSSHVQLRHAILATAVLILSVVFLALTVSTAPAAARSPVAVVADGKPWAMTMMPDGRTSVLTLRPDGTGSMTMGSMRLSPSWHVSDKSMCIKPSMLIPERCFVLTAHDGGFDGVDNGKPVLMLRRQVP